MHPGSEKPVPLALLYFVVSSSILALHLPNFVSGFIPTFPQFGI
jgi:hypothetical protein